MPAAASDLRYLGNTALQLLPFGVRHSETELFCPPHREEVHPLDLRDMGDVLLQQRA